MRLAGLVAGLLVMSVVAAPAADSPAPASIEAAIESDGRTERDRALDSSRKPREYLRFAGVRRCDTVAEINAGGGYLARLLPALVTDCGHVYASNAAFVLELFDGINGRLSESLQGFRNVTVSEQPDDSVHFAAPLDIAILNNIYHDLHWQNVDTARLNRSILAALKPGGVLIIGDHSAAAGSGTSVVESLHRIERQIVIDEVEAAGFELIGSADFLANPDDDRSTHVIDETIRGRTDRFVLKFQRPE